MALGLAQRSQGSQELKGLGGTGAKAPSASPVLARGDIGDIGVTCPLPGRPARPWGSAVLLRR